MVGSKERRLQRLEKNKGSFILYIPYIAGDTGRGARRGPPGGWVCPAGASARPSTDTNEYREEDRVGRYRGVRLVVGWSRGGGAGWSREDRRQFVQVHDGGRVARLQPQRLAVRRSRLLVFPVQVEDRAQVRVAPRLVRPQPRRVPVPHLRVLQPPRLPKRGRGGHRQLVIGSGKLRGAELLLGGLRQSALGRQEQPCQVTNLKSDISKLAPFRHYSKTIKKSEGGERKIRKSKFRGGYKFSSAPNDACPIANGDGPRLDRIFLRLKNLQTRDSPSPWSRLILTAGNRPIGRWPIRGDGYSKEMVKKRGGWLVFLPNRDRGTGLRNAVKRRGEGVSANDGEGGMKRHESTLRRAAGIARNSFPEFQYPSIFFPAPSSTSAFSLVFPFFFDQLPLPRKMLHRYLELFFYDFLPLLHS